MPGPPETLFLNLTSNPTLTMKAGPIHCGARLPLQLSRPKTEYIPYCKRQLHSPNSKQSLLLSFTPAISVTASQGSGLTGTVVNKSDHSHHWTPGCTLVHLTFPPQQPGLSLDSPRWKPDLELQICSPAVSNRKSQFLSCGTGSAPLPQIGLQTTQTQPSLFQGTLPAFWDATSPSCSILTAFLCALLWFIYIPPGLGYSELKWILQAQPGKLNNYPYSWSLWAIYYLPEICMRKKHAVIANMCDLAIFMYSATSL